MWAQTETSIKWLENNYVNIGNAMYRQNEETKRLVNEVLKEMLELCRTSQFDMTSMLDGCINQWDPQLAHDFREYFID